nr:tetratricopeptide repeat protein [Acidobacteriota bacterium]
ALRPLVVRSQTYDFLRRARAARESARLEQAVALYRDAIESNGGYFAPADLELGFALSSLRRTDEAINQLLLVIRRSGSRYPVAFYHLGRLYEHTGQFAQAGDAYARAAELMGDTGPQFFADLSRAREKQGKPAEALAAMESYVRATGRLGDVPAWARERLAKLRQQEAPAQPAAANK